MLSQFSIVGILLVLVCIRIDAIPTSDEEEDIDGLFEGCTPCGDYRCPSDPKECLLGSVPDVCGCCSHTGGVCARLAGESCWNASIPELPRERRNDGLCARNYVCQLRDDLEPGVDQPEATCVCMESSPACGSNNRTYPTPCALREEAALMEHRWRRASTFSPLTLLHLGPCPTRPSIYTPPDNIIGGKGQLIALSCEAKGFPIPDLYWEFQSADGNRNLILPTNDPNDGEVSMSEGPEPYIRASWLQLARLQPRHVGAYQCVANNSLGQASAAANVVIGLRR